MTVVHTEAAPPEAVQACFDEVFSLAYEELRRLASAVRSDEEGQTLDTTALVHEAWMRMRSSPELAGLDEPRFRRIAARAMRQVLIDAARRRTALRRGGGAAVEPLDELRHGGVEPCIDQVLALDEALNELSSLSPRQATLIELRFFAGMEVGEAASALEVSEATAHRDWRAARAWLAGRLDDRDG